MPIQFGGSTSEIITGQIDRIVDAEPLSVQLQPSTVGDPIGGTVNPDLTDIWMSRSTWQARPAQYSFIPDETYEGIIVHHTAGQYTFTDDAARAAHMRVLDLSDNHTTSQDLPDSGNFFDITLEEITNIANDLIEAEQQFTSIPYSFVIFDSGLIAEGRGFNARAASTFSATYLAVCFAGDYTQTSNVLTTAQLDSFSRLRQAFLLDSPQATAITYHQAAAVVANTGATACPGINIISKVNDGSLAAGSNNARPSGTLRIGGGGLQVQ